MGSLLFFGLLSLFQNFFCYFHYRYVKPVYIVCKNSDGTFDAPNGEDNSVESAMERIAFNARILQTFTAENLNAHGFGRKTFRLQEDENGCVHVNIFKSKLGIETAHKMTGPELYEYFKEGKISNTRCGQMRKNGPKTHTT